MGCSSSKPNMIAYARGNEKDFRERFVEESVLGQGEFGVVKKCIDLHARSGDENQRVAVKILRKGMTFKDNTLYMPLKPEVLMLECAILKDLGGRFFIPELFGVWESNSLIYIVTEVCYGGEMMQYIAKAHSDDLSTEDVSRISWELLTAMDHCAKHGIIHRDMKPENIMFRSSDKGSSLRVIDFGCATRDEPSENPAADPASPDSDLVRHTTFAGTAFYISPEMFQRNYNVKTDIWSVGVTLYVLVAGYPAHCLQKAFNMLQCSDRNLRELPDMPQNELPDSYFNMLTQLLTYKPKHRVTAKEILEKDEFVNFHKKLSADVIADETGDAVAPLKKTSKLQRQVSILKTTSLRHSAYLQYEKFERSVTALLAAILSQKELREVLEKLTETAPENDKSSEAQRFSETANKRRLKVIQIKKLKEILDELKQHECTEMLNNLPNAAAYEGYAYHWDLLNQFAEEKSNKAATYAKQAELDNSMGRRTRSLISITRKNNKDLLDLSDHGGSNTSHKEQEEQDKHNSSIHGTSVFASFKNKRKNKKRMDVLNASSHF